MRADARRNRDQLLGAAHHAIARYGADASLRNIARMAGVGMATLLRHFPTREALFDALLNETLDALTLRAGELLEGRSPHDALASWLRDAVGFVRTYSGVVDLMAVAIADPESPLHASCTRVREAGARLLARAQADGGARADVDGVDLFALIGALGWIGDQPSFAARADHLLDVVVGALLTRRETPLGNDGGPGRAG